MTDSDGWAAIKGKVQGKTSGAVLFAVGLSVPRGAWIPLRLIHVEDQATLRQKTRGDDMTLRIRRWKAEEVGFIAEPDDQTDDLFHPESGLK